MHEIPCVDFHSVVDIEDALRIACPRLKNESRPLLTLMSYRNARFFLPIFYSLCRILRLPFYRMFRLRLFMNLFEQSTDKDGSLLMLLNYLDNNVEGDLIHKMSEKFTFDTIIYCGLQYGIESQTDEDFVQSQVQYWLENVKEHLLSCLNFEEIKPVVLKITMYCFPVVSTTEPIQYFIWNPFEESWCLVMGDLNLFLKRVLSFVWLKTQNYMIHEFQRMDFRKDRETLWLSFKPDWKQPAKGWALQVTNSSFKIHHGLEKLRRLTHNRILDKLFENYECANVPEFYFIEKKILHFLKK